MKKETTQGGVRRLVFALALAAGSNLLAANTWWVSQLSGDDAYPGEDIGTEAHPFATIQAGVDKATSGDTVKVLEGTYATRETLAGSCTNRVYINKKLYLVAPDGAAKTVIVGKGSSTDPTGATKTNTDNVRCVYVEAAVSGTDRKGAGTVIEGFTFKDGASFVSRGGGVACSLYANVYVVDCVFTNCTGCGVFDGTGPALSPAEYVNVVRCRFTDCTGWAIVGNGKAFACLFENCQTYRGVFGYTDSANCTMKACSGSRLLFNNTSTGCRFYNNLSTLTQVSGLFNAPSAVAAGGYVCPVDGSDGGLCADAANGDYRLKPDSPALGISDAAMVTNVLDFTLGIVPVSRKDRSGIELPLTGMINAGAYQEVRTRISVSDFPYGGVEMTGVEAGKDTWVDEDLEVTVVQAPSSGTRLCTGVATNGIPVLFADVPDGVRFTMTRDSASITLAPLYATDWYVDAAAGNDASNGFTRATAKRTLADICTNTALLAGDTIHAAAGIYNTGVCAPSAGYVIGARAAVPAGVTLKADGAADETVIEGAPATEGNRDNAALATGADGVRCVYLATGATVCGFTLRNGYTRGLNTAPGAGTGNPDFCGGAVAGLTDAATIGSRVVADCVISNCVATWGGACSYVRVYGCRVVENNATRLGRQTNNCLEENSFFDGKKTSVTVSFASFYPQGMINSTYGDGNIDGAIDNNQARPPTNCVFLGKLNNSAVARQSHNCIFVKYTTEVVREDNIENDTCLFTNRAALKVDADYKPSSADSPLVDFCTTVPAALADRDAAGGQRVYNGRIDCGAYEYDWRDAYTAAVGSRHFAVTNASPGVVLADGTVTLTDGSSVVCAWVPRPANGRREIPVSVTGAGVLSVIVDGVIVGEAHAGDTCIGYTGRAETESVRLVFSGEGSATFTRPRVLSGLSLIVR